MARWVDKWKYKPLLSLPVACSTQVIDQDNQSQQYWNLYEKHASNVTHFLNGYFKRSNFKNLRNCSTRKLFLLLVL